MSAHGTATSASPPSHSRTGQSAPELWLERYGDAMYRYAFLRLGRSEAAEEAVQEALLHALTARQSFQARSSERTWLIGILRHKIIDRIRRDARQRSAEDIDVTALHLPSGASSDAPLERSERHAALLHAVAALPEPMRQAICLRELDGLTTSQVCEVMDITPTNLWTLIHRAKARLRDDLAHHWHDETDRSNIHHRTAGTDRA